MGLGAFWRGVWGEARSLQGWLRPPEVIDFPWKRFDFAVAATTGLYLCTRERWVRLLSGHYAGIAFAGDRMLAFDGHPGLKRGRIRRIGKDGRCRIVAGGFDAEPHALDVWEGRLYAAGGRLIRVFDLSNWEETDQFGPLRPPQHDETCRVNGVHFRDNQTYVLCDAGGNSTLIRGDRAFSAQESLPLPAQHAHSLAFLGKQILICDTGGRRLIDTEGPLAHFDGNPCGLAVTSETIAVGVSKGAEGRLVFLDHGFRPTGSLSLPGAIAEVRALFRPDGGQSEGGG